MSEKPEKRHTPWWVYLLVVVAANLGRQQLMPTETSWTVNTAATVATIAVAIVLYRAVARDRTDR